jgi:hypothetical protein
MRGFNNNNNNNNNNSSSYVLARTEVQVIGPCDENTDANVHKVQLPCGAEGHHFEHFALQELQQPG